VRSVEAVDPLSNAPCRSLLLGRVLPLLRGGGAGAEAGCVMGWPAGIFRFCGRTLRPRVEMVQEKSDFCRRFKLTPS
jgi:hypothetical protein